MYTHVYIFPLIVQFDYVLQCVAIYGGHSIYTHVHVFPNVPQVCKITIELTFKNASRCGGCEEITSVHIYIFSNAGSLLNVPCTITKRLNFENVAQCGEREGCSMCTHVCTYSQKLARHSMCYAKSLKS